MIKRQVAGGREVLQGWLSAFVGYVFGSVAKTSVVLWEEPATQQPMHKPTLPSQPPLFKWRHFQAELILLSVRWYLRYPLSYRQVEELVAERGLSIAHTTIYRWVQAYAPELDKRCRAHLRATNDSWKVDETYIKVKGRWCYLYRAVDSARDTLDFLLTAKRDAKAAKRFLRKALKASHNSTPRVINVDKNPAYSRAMDDLKAEEVLPENCALRQVKYLNNLVEQDHRSIKRLSRPGLGFQGLRTAWRTIRGYEAMNMLRKGQIIGIEKGAVQSQVKFIENLFGLAA